MKIYLRDFSASMVEAWKTWFDGSPDVDISVGDIFSGPKAQGLISPANSFGFMDGGIDLIYSKKFGWDLQTRLQKELNDNHDGELPVGDATIVETNNKDYPFLISAPTMRIPMPVANTMNAYLAFRAALRIAKKNNFESILCPGLGTSVGMMPHSVAAKQMFYAYMVVIQGKRKEFNQLSDAVNNHYSLTRDF